MNEGARVWLIPDGFLPEESSETQESHEAICILNTSIEEAQLLISFYFEDREPIKDVRVTVPPERTLHMRLDLPEHLGGCLGSQGRAPTRCGWRAACRLRSSTLGWTHPRRLWR